MIFSFAPLFQTWKVLWEGSCTCSEDHPATTPLSVSQESTALTSVRMWEQAGLKKDVGTFLFSNSSVGFRCNLHWSTVCLANSVSDLGSLCSQWRGPENPQTQLCGCGRQHLRVWRRAGGKSYQWSHGLQHRLRLMLKTQWAVITSFIWKKCWTNRVCRANKIKTKLSVSHYSLTHYSN